MIKIFKILNKKLLLGLLIITLLSYLPVLAVNKPVSKPNVPEQANTKVEPKDNLPSDVSDMLYKIRKLYSNNQNEQALQTADEAINKYPDNELFYTERGIIKINLKNYKGALSDFTKAIHINSANTAAYIGRASAKYGLKDNKGAIQDLKQCLELNPQETSCQTLLDAVYKRTQAQ